MPNHIPTKRAARRSGFTLVEMVIVMLIIGIISYVIALGFMMSSRTMKTMERRSDVAAFLQESIERSVDSLRAANGIVNASQGGITVTLPNGNQMSIVHNPAAKTVLKDNNAIAYDVTSFQIAYFNANGSATNVLSAIRSAKFTISGTSGGEPWTLESSVMFRKLLSQI